MKLFLKNASQLGINLNDLVDHVSTTIMKIKVNMIQFKNKVLLSNKKRAQFERNLFDEFVFAFDTCRDDERKLILNAIR